LRARSLLRIKRIGRELHQKNSELVTLQRQKDELSALIVHDLKNPLAAILTNGTFLLDFSKLSEDARPVVRDMLSAAESMRRMVMNLLDLSRSEDGALTLSVESIAPSELVADAIHAMEGRAAEREQRLRFEIEGELPRIQGDYELLRRMIENLLDNSFKYTPKRGEIVVYCASPDPAHVEFRVHDQGPGVPEAYRERVFEKYVQLESEAKYHGRTSRGLGLSYCKVAVEAHGGSIRAEESAAGGAAFRVRLPLAPPPHGRRLAK
jgi:signal transduction histidine kinase